MTPVAAITSRRRQHQLPWSSIAAAAFGLAVAVGAAAAHAPVLALIITGGALLALFVAAAIEDVRNRVLPNRLLAPAGALLTTALPAHAIVTNDVSRLGQGLLGGVIAGGVYIFLWLTGATGGGDVKLSVISSTFATYLSWPVGAAALFAPYLLALPAVGYYLARAARGKHLPFGPYLVAGFASALLVSATLR